MVVAARAALEVAQDSERAEALAWVQEAEQCLNSAEEVSVPPHFVWHRLLCGTEACAAGKQNDQSASCKGALGKSGMADLR